MSKLYKVIGQVDNLFIYDPKKSEHVHLHGCNCCGDKWTDWIHCIYKQDNVLKLVKIGCDRILEPDFYNMYSCEENEDPINCYSKVSKIEDINIEDIIYKKGKLIIDLSEHFSYPYILGLIT
jgi:hypothetical protein